MQRSAILNTFGIAVILGTLGCGKASPTASSSQPVQTQPTYGVQAGGMMPTAPSSAAAPAPQPRTGTRVRGLSPRPVRVGGIPIFMGNVPYTPRAVRLPPGGMAPPPMRPEDAEADRIAYVQRRLTVTRQQIGYWERILQSDAEPEHHKAMARQMLEVYRAAEARYNNQLPSR